MSHDELRSAYAAARAHILPSWFETPGLSSLEAGLSGCSIATTDRGSTREYFRDLADYCDPASTVSIRRAALRAYDRPRSEQLKRHILDRFTWEAAGRQTAAAYDRILKS
jgi:glycosyltransferase involved in cell wall biosynthesis